MICMRRPRPMNTATVTVKTRGLSQFVGPVCAKRMGLLKPAQPRRTVAAVQDQPDLFDELSQQKCKVEC